MALSLAGCMDLDVVNENNPDRERALSEPGAVENVLARTFFSWYNTPHGLADVAHPFPVLGDEMTNTILTRSVQWSREPREAFRNDDLSPEIWIPRRFYDNFSECVASANDALGVIKDGMRIETVDDASGAVVDNTDRAVVWGKLWQGICTGYLALTLDRFAIATEDTILPQGFEALKAWETRQMDQGSNWKDRLEIALNSIDEAIALAQTGAQWLTPANWINGQQYTNAQLIQFANTMAARFMIYSARYPADRAALDWNEILDRTNKGLTYDWGPTLQSGVITDPSYLSRLLTTGSSQLRADYRMIGRADQSGRYQTWLATPVLTATRFDIVTPDRRITGTTPTSSGAYFRYLGSNTSGFDNTRGEGYWSNYGWYRRSNSGYGGYGTTTGHFALASVDENRLFKAEALLRLGRTQEAVDLINVTRTRGVKIGNTTIATNLPPLTTAGVPTVNGACVPRMENGQCGSLMDALNYERLIELTGQSSLRAWMDRRGFGDLQPGTFVHLPVPARYLVQLNIPNYTFGGVGGNCAAGSACQ